MGNRPCTASIQILDDDSLLHVFHLYRPFLLGEDEDDNNRMIGGLGSWVRGRWWYTLAHVCRRWRNVLLRSASYLDLSLVCTKGTPVADMLAFSPPLPLVIDHIGRIAPEDEEGTILALKQRDRVRRVRFLILAINLPKLIMAIDEEYPILEYLIIESPVEDKSTILTFPETLRAPRLRQLVLRGFALPIGSRLLTTAAGLVTLYLSIVHPSTYFHPNTLLQWISLMPQLETLTIFFNFSIPNSDVESQLTHMPIIAPVRLLNLRHFQFHGVSTYLEAFFHRITAPRLEKLEIEFFTQLTFFFPCLLQFMSTAEYFRFDSVRFWFFRGLAYARVYLHGNAEEHFLSIAVLCWHLDGQVSSMIQIFNSLSQMLSAVEHLTLDHEVHSQSSEEHNEVDRTEWRKLLSSFSNVKTLRILKGLAEELSRCLQLEDEEFPLELLPELQELTYSGSGDTGDAFTSFINARQNAGHPVTLVLNQDV